MCARNCANGSNGSFIKASFVFLRVRMRALMRKVSHNDHLKAHTVYMNILYTNTPGNYHRDKSEQPLYEHNAISHKISTMRKRFDTKKKLIISCKFDRTFSARWHVTLFLIRTRTSTVKINILQSLANLSTINTRIFILYKPQLQRLKRRFSFGTDSVSANTIYYSTTRINSECGERNDDMQRKRN